MKWAIEMAPGRFRCNEATGEGPNGVVTYPTLAQAQVRIELAAEAGQDVQGWRVVKYPAIPVQRTREDFMYAMRSLAREAVAEGVAEPGDVVGEVAKWEIVGRAEREAIIARAERESIIDAMASTTWD